MPDRDDVTIIARHLIIHGKVQGVYYRASAETRARELGLRGWVRNKHDGTVEAVAAGPKEAVEAFIRWAHEGPAAARVERVDSAACALPEETVFAQRPSA